MHNSIKDYIFLRNWNMLDKNLIVAGTDGLLYRVITGNELRNSHRNQYSVRLLNTSYTTTLSLNNMRKLDGNIVSKSDNYYILEKPSMNRTSFKLYKANSYKSKPIYTQNISSYNKELV